MTYRPLGKGITELEGVPIALIARVMRAVCEGEAERCDHKNFVEDGDGYMVPRKIWRAFRQDQTWGFDTGHRFVQGIPLVMTEYKNLTRLAHFNGNWRFTAKIADAARFAKDVLYVPSNQGDKIVDDARVYAANFSSAEIHNTDRFRHDMTIFKMFYHED